MSRLSQKLQQFNEKVKGYRTLIWNFLVVGVFPVILYIVSMVAEMDLASVLTPVNVLVVTVMIKGVDSYLRYITTTPVGGEVEDLGAN